MMADRRITFWCGGCDLEMVLHLSVDPARAHASTFMPHPCACGANDWRTKDTRRGRTFSDVLTTNDRRFLRSLRITQD